MHQGHSSFPDVDRRAPSGARRASSSSGTRLPRQEKTKRNSRGRAPSDDEALEKLTKPSTAQSDSPAAYDFPSHQRWETGGSISASETESWDGDSDGGGAEAAAKGLGPPPAGLLQEPEEHTWAGSRSPL